MKLVVINGTEKHGVTYRMKELFLESLRPSAQITEFWLPKDCPHFCAGCTSCFSKGESACKDAQYVQAIEKAMLEADVLVFTTPAYVMHATGAMKAMLDHFGYRWMPHRPAREMFSKRAVILSQCLGAGAKSAAKDIRDSLSWWGVSHIDVYATKLMKDIHWDKLDEKKRAQMAAELTKLANKTAREAQKSPAKTGLTVKVKFMACRMIQQSVRATQPDSMDVQYWAEQGWLGKKRPWQTKQEAE